MIEAAPTEEAGAAPFDEAPPEPSAAAAAPLLEGTAGLEPIPTGEAPAEKSALPGLGEAPPELEADVIPPAGEPALEVDAVAGGVELGIEGVADLEGGGEDTLGEPDDVEAPDLSPVPADEATEAPDEATEAPDEAQHEPDLEPPGEAPPEAAAALPDEEALPLAPGTVIGERYLLVESLETVEGQALYLAQDLARCWQCGFEGNAPGDRFCAQCGATLDRKSEVRLLQVSPDRDKPELEEAVIGQLDDEGRRFFILPQPEAGTEHEDAPQAPALRLRVGQASDTGRIRELNEDSLLSLTLAPDFGSGPHPLLGLYAVADGMGGHEGGEVASRLALQVLARQAMQSIVIPELEGAAVPEQELAGQLAEAVISANDAVFLARQKRDTDMGTTLTVALVRDDALVLAHVGDSRAYLWDDEGLQQLTTDHSLVARLVASGQIEPQEVYTHPHRSVIYRSVGDRPLVDVDSLALDLQPGDRIILCSDGLWEMIRTEGIEDVMMQEADPQAACNTLVRRANLAGGEDNISVIVVLAEAI